MPEIPSVQSNFTSGELSPRLVGRSDLAKYVNGLAENQNFILQKHGGIMRRSGTRFVAEVKDSTRFTRLIPFTFSTGQTYNIELGHLYARFYRDKGRLQHGVIFTVSTASWAAGVVTLTAVEATLPGLAAGDEISVRNIVGADANNGDRYNGVFIVTAILGANQLTYAESVNPGAYVSGGTFTETTGSLPTEIVTPYTEADLPLVKFIQSADIMWLTHRLYEPRTLKRVAGADADPDVWKLATFPTIDGPYQSINVIAAALFTVPIGAAGASIGLALNAAAKAAINGGRGFESTDVGRLVTWRFGSEWTWGKITAVTDARNATVLLTNATIAGSTDIWRMGAWSNTTGFPRTSFIHKQRLCFASSTAQPQTIWLSAVGAFDDFVDFIRSGATEGDVLDDQALTYTIDDNVVNTIYWLRGDAKGLAVLTDGGTFLGASTSPFEQITPLTFTVARQLSDGAAERPPPHNVSSTTLFIKTGIRRLLEFTFVFEADRFVAPDLTLLAEHITLSGVTDTAFQSEPDNVVWATREDGLLIAMTYERPEDVVGWHRHIIGGTLAGEAHPAVESVSVIRDGDDDLLWLIVKRTIGGVTKRYVEFMEPLFADDAQAEDAFYVDSGLSLFSPVAISAATQANPVMLTTTITHGFVNGDRVRVRDVKGMTQINDLTFLVANATATTFTLQDLAGVDIDGTGYSAYVSGGTAAREETLLAGLTHLAGETVKILADGATHADKVVTGGGGVTLDVPASLIHVGLGFKSRGRTMPIVPRASFETRGAVHRPNEAIVYLNRSIGGLIGSHTDEYEKLDSMSLRQPPTPMGHGPPLFTGAIKMPIPGRSSYQVSIVIEAEQPLPLNVLSIVTKMEVADV